MFLARICILPTKLIIFSNVQFLLESIETFDKDVGTDEGADQSKGWFTRFITAGTTTSTVRPFLTLILGLNPDALPMGNTVIMSGAPASMPPAMPPTAPAMPPTAPTATG